MNQVSVMIPVFNMEKHINKCIDSVLAQTYDNLSIILVNDGSHDSSGEICEEYKEKDSRITVIHQENSGQSVARNRAIEIAEDINPDGYLIGLDSDDWLEPNYLMELVLLMEESQLDCAIGNGRRVSIDKTDNIIGIEDRILFNKDFVTDNLEDIYKIQANACAARVNDFNGEWSITALRSVATPWDKLFRISLIKENHLIFVEDMRSREDIIFSLYYLHLCKKVGYKKSNTGYNYRVSTDSVSHGYRKTIVEEDDKLISYMRGYIDVIADNKAHATIVNQGVLLATIRFFIEECIRYFITKDGKKSEKVEMIEKRMMSESIMNAAFNVNRGNLSESEKTIVSYIKQHKPEKIYDILRWL